MRDVAADRAAIAHRRIADMLRGFGERRTVRREPRTTRPAPRASSTRRCERHRVSADAFHLGDATDVDERGGERRAEASAAG